MSSATPDTEGTTPGEQRCGTRIGGTAAAVVDAAFSATGVQGRELPVMLEKLLPGLP